MGGVCDGFVGLMGYQCLQIPGGEASQMTAWNAEIDMRVVGNIGWAAGWMLLEVGMLTVITRIMDRECDAGCGGNLRHLTYHISLSRACKKPCLRCARSENSALILGERRGT